MYPILTSFNIGPHSILDSSVNPILTSLRKVNLVTKARMNSILSSLRMANSYQGSHEPNIDLIEQQVNNYQGSPEPNIEKSVQSAINSQNRLNLVLTDFALHQNQLNLMLLNGFRSPMVGYILCLYLIFIRFACNSKMDLESL